MNTVQAYFSVLQLPQLSTTTPVYLTELKVYKPVLQLRSSSVTSILCLPSAHMHSLGQETRFLCCTVCLEQSPLQG